MALLRLAAFVLAIMVSGTGHGDRPDLGFTGAGQRRD